jgi:hypothetical protein
MEKEDAFKLLYSINEEILHQYSELLKIGNILCRTYESEKLKLPYHLNIIDELHINENGHSRILMRLFCYRNEKGEYEFLKSFIDYIQSNTHSDEFKRIKIDNPTITQEEQRIDLWVRDKSYAIIFENKVYNASDQDAQLHRYIEKTKGKGYNTNNIFVIYLPQYYHEPDEQSWGEYKRDFESRFVIIPFQDGIIKWLKEYVLPNIRYKDQYLFSAVTQYIDYLEGLFGIRTINNRLIMNLERLFEEQFELSKCSSDKKRMDVLIDKISDFQTITNQMRSLKNKYRQNIIDSWQDDIRNRYPMLQESTIKDKYVGVDINYYGKVIHVFVYANSQLYCQVEYDNNLPAKERLIANTPVMKLSDILNKTNETQLWKYFNIDDVEGVYDCFIKVVERCINSL